MYIDSYNYTNKGKYPVNEDSFLCGGSIFAVADGLGGHGGGDTASDCAVRYISENYRSAQELTELISGANNAVRELDNGSRSTVAAAFVEDENFHYINVGDSRVYFFRNGKLLCRTKDHSVCQAAVDAGTMTEDEIRGHEDRSRLLKVLGENETLKLPSYEPITLCDGDAFLICSDGFWEFVYETEMEIDLLKADSAQRWSDFMLRRHLKRSHCEDDNFTLVCGIVHKVPTDNITYTSSPAEIAIGRPGEATASLKKDHRALVGFVVGILVCAALFVGGYFLVRYLSDKNSSPSDASSESVSSTDGSTSESSDNDSGNSSEISSETSDDESSGSGDSSEVSNESSEFSESSDNTESGSDLALSPTLPTVDDLN